MRKVTTRSVCGTRSFRLRSGPGWSRSGSGQLGRSRSSTPANDAEPCALQLEMVCPARGSIRTANQPQIAKDAIGHSMEFPMHLPTKVGGFRPTKRLRFGYLCIMALIIAPIAVPAANSPVPGTMIAWGNSFDVPMATGLTNVISLSCSTHVLAIQDRQGTDTGLRPDGMISK